MNETKLVKSRSISQSSQEPVYSSLVEQVEAGPPNPNAFPQLSESFDMHCQEEECSIYGQSPEKEDADSKDEVNDITTCPTQTCGGLLGAEEVLSV